MEASDSDSSSSDMSTPEQVDINYTKNSERSKIREEISTMSFEELMKLKDQLGSKIYSEAVFGSHREKQKSVKREFKRDNKNRPRESGAKRPVSLLGNAKASSALKATEIRDPRFDAKCGEFDVKKFKENFGFVSEIKDRELKELKERLKSCTDFKEQKKLKYLIQRMHNQNTESRKLQIRKQIQDEDRLQIQTAKKESKVPYFKTDRERKAQELVQQYLDLKQSGKLNKHLEKRRKKNVSRDRKKFSFD